MGSISPPPSPTNKNPKIPIPPPTTLTQIRTGRLKQYANLSIPTGIYKDAQTSRLHISKIGLPDDEHDLTFHGGPDKAIHQYNTDLYPEWQALYPDAAASFVEGGFGENFVAAGWSERNICIGDKVRAGSALLEVSIPRQPCFKLNQKFKIRNFAPKTHERAWTGWYYRVLEEGEVEAGAELEVVERVNERWSVERMHHYIHREKWNREVMEELVCVEALGMETKGPFLERLKKLRGGEEEEKQPEVWRKFKCVEKERETKRVWRIVFELAGQEDDDSAEVMNIQAGSHVRLKLPNGLIRPYSVVSGTTQKFTLGVAREENSRGGSAYLCDELEPNGQQIIQVGKTSESLKINNQASQHIIIAGGIGITAFLDVMNVMDKSVFAYDLHYAVRDASEIPFLKTLQAKGEKLHIYDASKGQRMNISSILENRKWNSHIYVCGPRRMMDQVKSFGLAPSDVHYENFQIDTEGDPFEAEVVLEGDEKGSKDLKVAEKQTLLQVMRDAGLEMDSSCEVGNCGTCKVRLLEGEVDHRGVLVEEGEMLSCVSRGKGKIKVGLMQV